MSWQRFSSVHYGSGSQDRSRNQLKLSSINSIRSTGLLDSGSWYVPKYCTICGCFMALKRWLLLKLLHHTCSSRSSELKEGRVEDFGSTGQVITHGLADGTVWPNTKRLSFEEFNSLIVKLILVLGLLSHCSSRPAIEVTPVEMRN